jgi:hypothetical protein
VFGQWTDCETVTLDQTDGQSNLHGLVAYPENQKRCCKSAGLAKKKTNQ